ncbi:MAG: elongation factor P [Candidatus Paraimprobicoccus trichonymphae]|uniref:Elongation factor P n=1 Tax=Candidatus Paraimprobicoccus trichonymphae TaxID=3033793 RepID=A0AA48KWH2_9FIRM|nr:MAG: elongation factor P [Candidatus Paraimprobicoccus trichonymphae]
MISAGDFRNGITFELDEDNIVSVVEFQHVKPGKGSAFVRAKIKNVINGKVIETTFNPNDKYQEAFIGKKDMQYLYNDGNLYYFMDTNTYEQIPINKKVLGDNFKFVKENMDCKILFCKGKVFGVEPPTFVKLKVIKTDPGFKGNTATNTLKDATLETYAIIKVPLFIEIDDLIRVDTRIGEYMSKSLSKK